MAGPMPDLPPPAPDWILGEDGHWKPPPFDSGARRGPMPPAAASTPFSTDPYARPPQPASTGPGVAKILAGLAVLGVAGIAVLVGAVTFLGQTPETGSGRTGLAASSDDDGPTTTAAGTEAADALPVEDVAGALAEELSTGDWTPTGTETVGLTDGVGVPGSCAPDGWLTGAVGRVRTFYGRPSNGSTGALTLSLTAYADDASAAAELERARSQAMGDCEVVQHRDEFPSATSVTVAALPDDPAAPGVSYQVTDAEGRLEYDFTVIVGRVRAHLDFCGCADLGLDGQRAVARQVAAILAGEQGLAVSG
jgi:hypothetical protein